MNDAAYAETHWAELQNQGDLAWGLDAVISRSEAIAFLERFKNRLCTYSAYVEKLYSDYSFMILGSGHNGITIPPSEQVWHDTFHDIPLTVMEPTGIHILSGEITGYRRLYLKILGEYRLMASRELLFQKGLELLIQRYRAHNDVFLPILAKGDLYEYEAYMPSPHLRRINPVRLSAHSLLSPNAIKDAIADRLIDLFRQQRRADVTLV